MTSQIVIRTTRSVRVQFLETFLITLKHSFTRNEVLLSLGFTGPKEKCSVYIQY